MVYRILSGFWLAAFFGLLVAPAALAGGWTVVTLEQLPLNVQAGAPTQVRFLVRQHGQHPLELNPGEMVIHARQADSGQTLQVEAQATSEPGYYVAELVFPSAGVWTWEVHPGGFPTAAMPDLTVAAGVEQPKLALPSASSQWGWWQQLVLQVVTSLRRPSVAAAAPAAVALPQDQVAYGKALFVAKGCVTCHRHEAITTQFSVEAGPNLTYYKVIPEYVKVWLHDPKSIKPATQMPQLPLQAGEIKALIAFLSAEEKQAAATK